MCGVAELWELMRPESSMYDGFRHTGFPLALPFMFTVPRTGYLRYRRRRASHTRSFRTENTIYFSLYGTASCRVARARDRARDRDTPTDWAPALARGKSEDRYILRVTVTRYCTALAT